MSDNKTHFRKAFNSPYLSSADIVEPTVLTVSHVVLEVDKTKRTKDSNNTMYFKEKFIRQGEPLKPMILNATNSKTMRLLTNSDWLEDWKDVAVTIYVEQGIKFGRDTVDGLRISTEKPVVQKPVLQENTQAWERAKERLLKDGNLDAVKKHMDVTADLEKKLIEEVANG